MTATVPALLFRPDRSRIMRARSYARILHPGPLGEFLSNELEAWSDFGHRFGGGTLMELVIVQLIERGEADANEKQKQREQRT